MNFNNIEITYALYATRDSEYWFKLGKELKSKKLVLSALKKTPYNIQRNLV